MTDRRAGWQTLEPRFYPGPGARARLGLLVLATDMAVEQDLHRYTDVDGVDCFVSRMPMALKVDKETLGALEDEIVTATENLVSWAKFDAIGFLCTSASIAVGPDTIRDIVHSVKPGVAVCNPIDAALDALAALDCQRIALMTPYIDEVNATLDHYLGTRGIELAAKAAFEQAGDPEINRIDPECILEEAVKLGGGDFDGIFISCTGMCTAGVVQRIEDQLGKPVVTSNQAVAWAMLRAAGVTEPIAGLGQLFTRN